MSIQWSNELYHYGMPRRSGRYKWGSGKNPYHHGASIPYGSKRDRKKAYKTLKKENRKNYRETQRANIKEFNTNRMNIYKKYEKDFDKFDKAYEKKATDMYKAKQRYDNVRKSKADTLEDSIAKGILTAKEKERYEKNARKIMSDYNLASKKYEKQNTKYLKEKAENRKKYREIVGLERRQYKQSKKDLKDAYKSGGANVAEARRKAQEANRKYNKDFNKSYTYSNAHPVSQHVKKSKHYAESDRRWEKTRQSAITYNEAKNEYNRQKELAKIYNKRAASDNSYVKTSLDKNIRPRDVDYARKVSLNNSNKYDKQIKAINDKYDKKKKKITKYR